MIGLDRLLPIDLERIEIRGALNGYHRDTVDQIVLRCAHEIETLLGELKSAREEVERSRTELLSYRSKETMITEALVLAQRTADETRASAHQQAHLIVEEGRVQASRTTTEVEIQLQSARAELESLKAERAQFLATYRAFLETTLKNLPIQLHVIEGNVGPTEPVGSPPKLQEAA